MTLDEWSAAAFRRRELRRLRRANPSDRRLRVGRCRGAAAAPPLALRGYGRLRDGRRTQVCSGAGLPHSGRAPCCRQGATDQLLIPAVGVLRETGTLDPYDAKALAGGR